MATGGSKLAIYGAIGANFCIAVMKFVASYFTGSASMLSEGIHSLIDTGNGGLLLYGIKRSQQEPDHKHPFGYGKEVFFWSFVVAIFIFAVGGGMAIYEGISHIQHPSVFDDSKIMWNYGVLIGGILVESVSFYLAFREFRRTQPTGFFSAIRKSKDAATFAVMIEDTAAMLGLVVALVFVFIGHMTGNPVWDGIGSIAIGVLLCSVSLFLARETKGLLVGESASDQTLVQLNHVLNGHDEVEKIGNLRTMHLGPAEVLLAVDVDFASNLNSDQVEAAVEQLEKEIQAAMPHVSQIYIEAHKLS
ncbi:MAG: cation diffusion facilitator family transporter [Flavobacteriales bacterium]